MTPGRIAVLVLTVAFILGTLPGSLRFNRYAFWDGGWPLTTDVLLDEGQRPVHDFGYFYGTLTLLIDRAVFKLFGRSPETLNVLYCVCTLLVAVGIVRVMAALNLGRVAALFLIVTVPFSAQPNLYPSPAHAIEAALLANALGFHAARRPGWALALVTAAVFVKPSLGYVYGLILLVLVLAGWPGGRNRWAALAPAIGVGVTLLALLTAVFGWEAVYRTQLPFDAVNAYKEEGFGFFFGKGKAFWQPNQLGPVYYLATPAGVWLCSTLFLVIAAIRLIPRVWEPTASVTVTCAVLHLVFVCFLFGGPASWIYYPFLLFVGVAAGLTALTATEEPDAPDDDQPAGGGLVRGIGIALVVLALLNQYPVWMGTAGSWAQFHRTPEAAGLYIRVDETAPWIEARTWAKSEKVFILTRMGAVHLIAPEFDAPRSWCLTQATSTPAEFDRLRGQIAAANWVLVPHLHSELVKWDALADALRPFRKVGENSLFVVYQREPVK